MLANPQAAERFGDRSFAIISDKYLNFSSRVGYHYSVLDAYCGQTINMNYITFSLKGGRRTTSGGTAGSGPSPRSFGTWTLPSRSRETGWMPGFKNMNARIEEKLDQLGRLLILPAKWIC